MTPDELDDLADLYACQTCRSLAPCDHGDLSPEARTVVAFIAALREAWAEVERLTSKYDEWESMHAACEGLTREADRIGVLWREACERADAAEADNDRIGAMVEWLVEVIVDARDACQRAESVEPVGSPEWVESGIAMRTTALREVRKVLDRERTAHPSALDRVTRERDEARAEVERLRNPDLRIVYGYEAGAADLEAVEARAAQAEAAIARVRALCDEWNGASPWGAWLPPTAADEVLAALDGEA